MSSQIEGVKEIQYLSVLKLTKASPKMVVMPPTRSLSGVAMIHKRVFTTYELKYIFFY